MNENAAIGIVLLAAGASTRMGSPKQLLPFRGRSLLRHAAETALACACGPVVVVLGANGEALQDELRGLSVRIAHNGAWAEGMGSSIRAGIAALDADVAGALLMLCDQPFISVRTLTELLAVFERDRPLAVAAEYGGTPGVPALFDRSLFPELLALAGADGAKRILTRHRDRLRCLAVPEGVFDIDTPEEYARLAG